MRLHARLLVPLLAACIACAACGSGIPRAAPPKPAASKYEPGSKVLRDGPIGTYVSRPWGFSTASYWIEGPSGLVMIDTQFLLSAAEESIDVAEAQTGKKVALAIVLHANPDKFNGTKVFQSRGIKVVTSAQVKTLLPEVHAKRTKAFYERYAPDYPSELPAPDSFGEKTTELSAGGVTVKAHVVGAGCSEAHVVVEWQGHVFAGDLLANKTHAWLEIGKTDEWLKRIDEMKALSPKWVHPGRGASSDASLLDLQKSYLEKVIALVSEEKPKMPVDEAALGRIKAKIEAAYPGYAYPVFLEIGLPAEWERQAKKK